MRQVYNQELQQLLESLTRLANAANESLHIAMKAYNEDDPNLAQTLFSKDLRINAATVDIELDAYRIVVLQQPVADDLRQVFTVLQASSDIERIADHAVSIARSVIRRNNEHVSVTEADERINKMAEIVAQMLTDVTKAVVEHDDEAAREIASRDNKVDALLKELISETANRMESNSEKVPIGISAIQIATSLERIGDYVTNICERVVYLQSGSIVELN